eukprot:6852940-Heterocapsa_arctica.AAC.1
MPVSTGPGKAGETGRRHTAVGAPVQPPWMPRTAPHTFLAKLQGASSRSAALPEGPSPPKRP